MKRILALTLCLIMCLPILAGCGSSLDEDDKGAYVEMYLPEEVYDFDPAKAYLNDAALDLVSLLFEPLFKLTEDGKVEKQLVKSYTITEDEENKEYKMLLTLNDTRWSDGIQVQAEDIVYAWKRILNVENSYDAAALLFDIKNARQVKAGDLSIDDLGIYAVDKLVLEITFEGKIDYDQFLLNLTSLALCPLRENIAKKSYDWAKKPATMVCSGPFKIRVIKFEENPDNKYVDENGVNASEFRLSSLLLERNSHYYRDKEKDALDSAVTPYQIHVNFGMTDEEIKEAYDGGTLFFVGSIPLSLRDTYKNTADIADDLSTLSVYFNTKAEVLNNTTYFNRYGEETPGTQKLFSDKNVRKALSMVIDREAIADKLVFAKAAYALVPDNVFNAGSRKTKFRKVGGDLLDKYSDSTLADAKALLTEAGIKASDFTFDLVVPAYDENLVAAGEMVVDAWGANGLGFNVTLKKIGTIKNNDYYKYTDSTPEDIADDLYFENVSVGNFQVALIDYCALSADAFSLLAPFAKAFSGQGMNMTDRDENGAYIYEFTPHITGFDDEAYNAKIEEAFSEKDIDKRANILHEAEELLMDELPIVPIAFNQSATLTNTSVLSKITATYYCPAYFRKMKMKNYELYTLAE